MRLLNWLQNKSNLSKIFEKESLSALFFYGHVSQLGKRAKLDLVLLTNKFHADRLLAQMTSRFSND